MMTTGLRWGQRTDVGITRSANQDAVMANGTLFVVADGMGGHRGGEVASSIAADHFAQLEILASVEELGEAVEAANDQIRSEAGANQELANMGTTIVVIAVLPVNTDADPLRLAAANVGDSRLYLFENDEMQQVSDDHSLVNELVKAGQITEDEAARHPQRNVVTRALGAEPDVLVDTWELPARIGQRYLLCSDGLVNEVSDSEIVGVLDTFADPELAASQLVDLANASGGRDNITVLILDIVAAETVPE